ncbi:MAG: hypothetical protein ACRBB0_18460 [Pelagimonas sp.]|uniref:hypothetical protein n=1 Tax=Pelagimonas sp. TaxID=2073170 RepID=UPI003D6A8D7F
MSGILAFRLIILAAFIGWSVYILGPKIMPDPRYSSVGEDVLVGGKSENAHALVDRYKFRFAEFDGEKWQGNSRAVRSASDRVAQRLMDTPACTEQNCRYFFAVKAQKPLAGADFLEHKYQFYWAEADGTVTKMIEAHSLWRF